MAAYATLFQIALLSQCTTTLRAKDDVATRDHGDARGAVEAHGALAKRLCRISRVERFVVSRGARCARRRPVTFARRRRVVRCGGGGGGGG